MSNKPTVQIADCYLENHPSGCQILSGIPLDYPDEHQYYSGALRNGHRVWTSAVVSVEGDTVETLRTIYKVKNWIN
jgi:hypothetical protein